MKPNVFNQLLAFLADLQQGKISYSLAHHRDNALMVVAVVPGQRWEIEFFDDGSVEVEKFISDGEIYGESALNELLVKYSDRGRAALALPQTFGLDQAVEHELAEQF
jgi:hypothetical protein